MILEIIIFRSLYRQENTRPFVYAFVLKERLDVPGSVLDGWSRDPVFDALQTTKPERNEAGTRPKQRNQHTKWYHHRRRNNHWPILSILKQFDSFYLEAIEIILKNWRKTLTEKENCLIMEVNVIKYSIVTVSFLKIIFSNINT